jgi:hypothetical protein
VFTSNRFQAAPVVWSIDGARRRALDAVVLNSGGANACTGADGLADARAMAEATASALGTSRARRGVLDRADRRPAPHGRRDRRHRRRRRGCPPTGVPPPRRRS